MHLDNVQAERWNILAVLQLNSVSKYNAGNCIEYSLINVLTIQLYTYDCAVTYKMTCTLLYDMLLLKEIGDFCLLTTTVGHTKNKFVQAVNRIEMRTVTFACCKAPNDS